MKTPNLVAAAASVALAVASLAVFSSTSTSAAPLAFINGTKVTNLAPIVVHPDADTRVAAL